MNAKDAKGKNDNRMLQRMNTINPTSRKRQLENERMRQICTLLYAHTKFVGSDGVHKATCELLGQLKSRVDRHWEYYQNNADVQSRLRFLKKVIDIFFGE